VFTKKTKEVILDKQAYEHSLMLKTLFEIAMTREPYCSELAMQVLNRILVKGVENE